MPPDAALRAATATGNGLSDAEAALRLARDGPNALAQVPGAPAWRVLLAQFRSVVALLLAAGVVLAVHNRDWLDAAGIGAALALNVVLGFVMELRAHRAIEALLHVEAPLADVVRDGRVVSIDARAVVCGDVLRLDGGQIVAADARLLRCAELRAVESVLTGESQPTRKSADAVLDPATPLAERINMVYKGTGIATGTGRALVVATGMNTEVGRIGTLVGGVRHQPTLLERRLNTLGRQLAAVAVGVAALVAGIELFRGGTLPSVVRLAIAVAVAAVPEGLPVVVTITMAIGVYRMARRHALVRRLPDVETLGAATVICTDKTGTLTAGEQTVTRIWLPDADLRVTGEARSPEGSFLLNDSVTEPSALPDLVQLLRIGALANRADFRHTADGWLARGDPTDVALLVAALRAHLDPDTVRSALPEIGELPFSSERMLIATFHRQLDGRILAMVKGAPARVIPRCTRLTGGAALDAAWRTRIETATTDFAAEGLRVLALASGTVAAPNESGLTGLTFAGLVGMTDPPAPGVADTIRQLRTAGIRTIMITGDHARTASTIAHALGLTSADEALDGRAIDQLSDADLAERAAEVNVFGRASPEAKLRIVRALQRRGEIVAMIGDGMNDAAALKAADVGVAMGRRGTDMAKAVAGIVLADDRFATIAAAVEEGRVVFDNIRKFVFYLFSCNLAEILALLGAGVVGWPLPATALQILWLNLVTDTLPALALAVEPADRFVMRRPARDPGAPILSPALVRRTITFAAMIAAVTLAALAWGLQAWPNEPSRAVTMAFTTLALSQLFHLGNARSRSAVTALAPATSNPYALVAVGVCVGLQVMAITYSPLARVLGAVPLSPLQWLIAIGLAALPAAAGQLTKRHRERAGTRRARNSTT
jgi:Ca2+-transporting ATPase